VNTGQNPCNESAPFSMYISGLFVVENRRYKNFHLIDRYLFFLLLKSVIKNEICRLYCIIWMYVLWWKRANFHVSLIRFVRINQEYSCMMSFLNLRFLNIISYCCSFAKQHLRSLIESISSYYTHAYILLSKCLQTDESQWITSVSLFFKRCNFSILLWQPAVTNFSSNRDRKSLSRFLSLLLFPDGQFIYFYLYTHTYAHFSPSVM